MKTERLLSEAELAETFSQMEADRLYQDLESLKEALQDESYSEYRIKVRTIINGLKCLCQYMYM